MAAQRDVSIRLSVQGSQAVKAELQDVGQSGNRAFGQIVTGAEGAGRALRLLGPVISALSAGAMISFVRRTLDAAGGLGELAQQVGVSTDALQVYQFAASQTGISNEQMEQGFGTLTRRIGEAVGGSRQAIEGFERLGVKLLDAGGNVRSTESVIADIADRIKGAGSEAEKFAIAAEFFGDRVGRRLVPLLNEGADGLRRFEDDARASGAVLDKELIDAADRASDRIAALDASFRTLGRNLVAEVAPTLERIGTALNEMLFPSAVQQRLGEYEQIQRSLEGTTMRIAQTQARLDEIMRRGRERGIPESAIRAANPLVGALDRELAELNARRDQLDAAASAAFGRVFGQQPPAAPPGVTNPPIRPTGGGGAAQRDPFERIRERIQTRIWQDEQDVLRERNRLIEAALTPIEQYAQRMEKLGALVERLAAIGPEAALPEAAIIAEAEGALRDYNRELERTDEGARRAQDASRALGFTFQSAFEDAILRGRRLSDVLRGVGQDVARIFLRTTVTAPVANFLQNTLLPRAFDAVAGVFHGGGVVGDGTAPTRSVPALAFAGAERFHNGLWGADEFPAILQRGERVIPRGQSIGGPSLSVNMHVTVGNGSGGDPAAARQLAAEIGRQARAEFKQLLIEESRAGGLLRGRAP